MQRSIPEWSQVTSGPTFHRASLDPHHDAIRLGLERLARLWGLKDGEKIRVPVAGQHWQVAEVYSFGMTCYEVLTGKVLLDGLSMNNYDEVTVKGKRPKLPDHVPERLREII